MLASLRAWAYRKGLLSSTALPSFVVSVGNISMGGTGKSPFVMELARWAVEQKIRVAVLSRGYKRRAKRAWVLGPHAALPSAHEIGDEPWMIKQRVPDISLLVHRNRARVALDHWDELGSPELVILDDGFQHWQARRDRDVVMLDAGESIDQKSLPFGRLREQAKALHRASLVVITRTESVSPSDLEKLKKRIQKIVKEPRQAPWQAERNRATAPVIAGRYVFDSFLDFKGKVVPRPEKKKFLLLTGIAKPIGLRNQAQELGLNLEEEIFFPDHHTLSAEQEKQIERVLGDRMLLVSEKDWARWQEFLSILSGYVIRVRYEWAPGDQTILESFFREVKQCSTSR